jgi:phytoene/squalene synthetase
MSYQLSGQPETDRSRRGGVRIPADDLAVHDTMATNTRKSTNRESIQRCNRAITERFHVSLKVYKSIKALAQLSAVATGFLAIAEGADPLTTFALVATIVSGPEVLETLIAGSNT